MIDLGHPGKMGVTRPVPRHLLAFIKLLLTELHSVNPHLNQQLSLAGIRLCQIEPINPIVSAQNEEQIRDVHDVAVLVEFLVIAFNLGIDRPPIAFIHESEVLHVRLEILDLASHGLEHPPLILECFHLIIRWRLACPITLPFLSAIMTNDAFVDPGTSERPAPCALVLKQMCMDRLRVEVKSVYYILHRTLRHRCISVFVVNGKYTLECWSRSDSGDWTGHRERRDFLIPARSVLESLFHSERLNPNVSRDE